MMNNNMLEVSPLGASNEYQKLMFHGDIRIIFTIITLNIGQTGLSNQCRPRSDIAECVY